MDTILSGTSLITPINTMKYACKTLMLFVLFSFLASSAMAETFYVARYGFNGRSKATAKDRSRPWRTIQHGVNQANAGDTIVVLNGTYYEQVFFNKSGFNGNSITLKSENREGAKIIGSIGGNDVSYINVDGFDVTNRRLDAIQSKGITFNRCHHLVIRNNRVHDCRGGGISLDQSDSLLVEWNIVHANAFWNPDQHSGISVYQCQRRGEATGSVGVIIRNNTSFNNHNRVDNVLFGRPTDGNGIVVDDTLNLDPSGNGVEYGRKIIVENNYCFRNGGQGVHCYQSTDVLIRNNTLVRNMEDFEFGGEVSVVASKRVSVYNNIMFATPGRYVALQFESSRVWWDYNVLYNGDSFGVFNRFNTIYANPRLIPGTQRLSSDSPAIDNGLTHATGFPLDVDGKVRVINGRIDRGAKEFNTFDN